MPTKEQTLDVLGALATASMIAVGLFIGGHFGEIVPAGMGVAIAADILKRNHEKLKQWLSSNNGVLNHDIQQTLARAFHKALNDLEEQYFKLGEAAALPKNERDSVKAFFRDLREQKEEIFVRCTRHPVSEQEIREYAYADPKTATDKLWDRLAADSLLAPYGKHFSNFLRANLLNQVLLWFGEELKTNNRECNKAWRAFQRLLLEGIYADVKAVRGDLRIVEELGRKLDQLKDTVNHRLPDEPFQVGLETALSEIPKLMALLEQKVDVVVETTQRAELKVDLMAADVKASAESTAAIRKLLKHLLGSMFRTSAKSSETLAALGTQPESGSGVAAQAGAWLPNGLDHIRIIAWPDVNELATAISVHMKERNIPDAVDGNAILTKHLNSGTWDQAAVARGLTKILSALFVIAKRPHVGFDRRFSAGSYPEFPEAEIKFGLDQPYDQLEKRDEHVRYFWIDVSRDQVRVSFLDDKQCWGFRDGKQCWQLWTLSDLAVDFQQLSRGAMVVAAQFGMKVFGKAGKPWYGPGEEIHISLAAARKRTATTGKASRSATTSVEPGRETARATSVSRLTVLEPKDVRALLKLGLLVGSSRGVELSPKFREKLQQQSLASPFAFHGEIVLKAAARLISNEGAGSEVPYSLKRLHAVLNQFAVHVGDVLLELGVSCGILTRNGKSVVLNQEMSDEIRESMAAEGPHALHGLETLGPFVRDKVVEHVRPRLLLRSPQDDDLSPMLGNLVFSIVEGSEAYQSLRTMIKKGAVRAGFGRSQERQAT